MDYIKPDDLRQFSHGFKLVLPFDLKRNSETDPVNANDDTWEVRIVKPNGDLLVKTNDLQFLDNTVQKIAVFIEPLDLDRAGLYYYQVAKTTDGAVRSNTGTFTVSPSLPMGDSLATPESPLQNRFPIYDAQGFLISSDLIKSGSNLKWQNENLLDDLTGVCFLRDSISLAGPANIHVNQVPAGYGLIPLIHYFYNPSLNVNSWVGAYQLFIAGTLAAQTNWSANSRFTAYNSLSGSFITGGAYRIVLPNTVISWASTGTYASGQTIKSMIVGMKIKLNTLVTW